MNLQKKSSGLDSDYTLHSDRKFIHKNNYRNTLNMPRQGDGHIAQNAVDANVNDIAHGAGEDKVSGSLGFLHLPSHVLTHASQPNEVAGAKKAAPMPEQQKGAGLEGVAASGGSSQGIKQGDEVGQGAPKP